MKKNVDKRKPNGILDYIAVAITTFGVGFIPGAPGTYGSAVAVAIYLFIGGIEMSFAAYAVSIGLVPDKIISIYWAVNSILLTVFCIAGIWASGKTVAIFGREDPSQAVVDELIGQFITFLFVPLGISWHFVLAGFLLFRLFDIWKPFPINGLQDLPGGLGICADDIVAGVYAGICLSIGYAVSFIM